MRIALVPLDSRPPSWQFPLRIAQIAGDELVSPPREMLGTLHKGADQVGLLEWLTREATQSDAAVISWDALIYGGLVQSRAEGNPLNVEELTKALTSLDWRRCKGYLWLTVPRLGVTIASQQDWELHKRIAEYFRLWGEVSENPIDDKLAAKLKALEAGIGAETISKAWWLRRRNAEYARDALQLAATLGFRTCHVACEDNARTGPHLGEVAELRKLALELTAECRRDGREPPRFTFFDGTDECGSLLTARAILDGRNAPPLKVRLTLFPSSPSPDQYFGLFESHSLEDGLLFLAKFLGFEYRAEGKVQWLVCFGKQPQPDAFAEDPERVFSNPLLLPDKIEGDEPLFVADLQACNGGNPNLLSRLIDMQSPRLQGVSAWNTNFNALGYSAASLAAASLVNFDWHKLGNLFDERVLDDYFYQSIKRSELLKLCAVKVYDALDLTDKQAREMELVLNEPWNHPLFPNNTLRVEFTLPWNRLFETEVNLP